MTELRGFVQTVTGPIAPSDLGPTLMHEHLLCDGTPPQLAAMGGDEVPITLENIWELNYNWGRNHLGAARLQDRDVAVREMQRLLRDGGRSLVEVSNHGLQRDPLGLREIAERSGIQIVMGSGAYVEEFLSPEIKDRTVDQIAVDIVTDVRAGAGDTGVRAGIIGEIGCSVPWTPAERRTMQAAAIAQQETGAAITVHPGRNTQSPFEVLQCIRETGGDLSRSVIGHIDRTISDIPTLLRLAETGCIIEYDLFGIETTLFPFGDFFLPNDGGRVDAIRTLIAAGHLEQIVVSQDIYTRGRQTEFGGHGYGHIMRNVVPIMRRKGLSDSDINAILVENPARVLTFV